LADGLRVCTHDAEGAGRCPCSAGHSEPSRWPSSCSRSLGSLGDDLIEGQEADDSLFGELGDDTLLGGKVAVSLDGGGGADLCDGGEQDDAADPSCETILEIP
jgi:RTX calcium-binding nonapeptide repeat (4 copies)